jgi:hypothetical protein
MVEKFGCLLMIIIIRIVLYLSYPVDDRETPLLAKVVAATRNIIFLIIKYTVLYLLYVVETSKQ